MLKWLERVGAWLSKPLFALETEVEKAVTDLAHPAAPAVLAPATSLDTLAANVTAHLAAHTALHASYVAAKATHDTALANMKLNASALVAAANQLQTLMTSNTAAITAAMAEAAAAV